MEKILLILCCCLISFYPASENAKLEKQAVGPAAKIKKELLIADQSVNRIAIVNVETAEIVWSWRAAESNVRPEDVGWFNAPSDVKPVYNSKYILLNGSQGGVALVRIADKKDRLLRLRWRQCAFLRASAGWEYCNRIEHW